MKITFEEFKQIPPGEIIRTVTTRYQHELPGEDVTFVVKKGHGHHDWAIYYFPASKGPWADHRDGEKLFSEYKIKNIYPCDDETFSRYRY